jgi:hypothetical protein
MDDGSRHGSGLHLSVYGFTNADVDRLMFTLQDKFQFRCSIHYNRSNKPRIYIFKESMESLISLTKPFFVKEMLYKLPGAGGEPWVGGKPQEGLPPPSPHST